MLTVSSISKSFDGLKAVDNIEFTASPGEVLGLLGPNGAGKSTTMKMITGFLLPDFGDASICGHSIVSDRRNAQRCIGYVPENAPLYEEMLVREFLEFMAKMHEIPADKCEQAIDKVIASCSLQEAEWRKIEDLSKGYKRRVSLAQALIHDPKVLILDEPTDGLDPNQKHDVRELIRSLSKEKCILISTHILEEVEEICSRCLIIGKGKKLYEGTPGDLKSKSRLGRIQDVFRALTTQTIPEGVTL